MPRYIFDQAGSPYELPDTLSDSKSISLANKLIEKQDKLTPAPIPLGPTPEEVAAAEARLGDTPSSLAGDSLFRQAGSSVVRGAGNIADTYENIRQGMGSEDYQLSPEVDAMSEQAVADEAAGFTGRPEYNRRLQELSQAVGKEDKSFGDYIDIAGQGLAMGPSALADSAASGLELAAGAAATAGVTALAGPVVGAVTGGLIFGKKAKDVVETVDKVVTLSDRLKKGAKAVPKAVAKTAGRTSLLTADLTEQMRQEYKEANNGQEPSAKWYATNVPITMALSAAELGIITKALPKFPKTFKKDMKEATKFMSKKHSVEAAKRIIGGTGKIVAVAGAEAGQEYLQTWHEILAPRVDAESMKSFITSAAKELGKSENQTKSLVGLILGGAAGGTAKSISVAPAVSVGLTKDAALGTLKTVGKVSKATINALDKAKTAAGLKVLSQAERDSIRNDYEIQKGVVEDAKADINKKIDIVEKAETIEDILADEETGKIASALQEKLGLTDDDLTDPGKLKKLKDNINSTYRGHKGILEGELTASTLAKTVKQIGKGVKDTAVEAAVAAVNAVPEDVKVAAAQAAVATKKASKAAVESVKNLRSSTARGIITISAREGAKGAKKIINAAKDLEPSDLKRVGEIISEYNPDLGKKLTRMYKQRVAELKNFGQQTDDLVNKETLIPAISTVAEAGNIDGQSASSVAEAIKKTMAGRIADKETAAIVRKAIEAYKASDAFAKGGQGQIDAKNMRILEGKLNNADARLAREFTAENAAEAAETIKTKVSEGVDTVKEGGAKVVKKVKETAGKVEKAVKGKKVLGESKTHDIMTKVIEQIKKGKADLMVNAIPNMMAALKKRGYETLQDLNDLVEQFPELKQDKAYYEQLKTAFDKSMIVEQKDATEINEKTAPVKAVETVTTFTKKLFGC